MRASDFREFHRLTGISRLCLCLAVVGIITLGAAESTAAASANGGLPEIKVFNAEPLTLKDGEFALYSFVVWDATKIQVIESGEVIKEINSPASNTNKGAAKGRTTYEIRTGGSNSFDTLLVASNGSGKQEKKLTLLFDTKLQPKATTPPTDNKTESRSPKWLPQLTTSASSTSYSPPTTSYPSPSRPNPPEFFKCPSNCDSCLKPDDAAARGYTQRCSEQPCYYSPDNQQKWYCYSQPAIGWCCKDGKVYEATKDQCAQTGGITWYATQAEAIRACQQTIGWCCKDGKVYEATKDQCAQAGGIAWYATQAEAIRACQQMAIGWFCSSGRVYQGTQLQAAQAGATWYAIQAEAIRACQPSSPMGWCCIKGSLSQATQAQCAQMGGTWYATQAEAIRACQQPSPLGWCCIKGSLSQATQAQCAQMGGTWYATQAEAIRACRQTVPK